MIIRRIEALNYLCLRYVNVAIRPFEILVGPNASGKSTFLDVIGFVGDLVSSDLQETISKRSDNLQDLMWKKKGDRFELAVEVEIPDSLREKIRGDYNTCRYEVAVGIEATSQENTIQAERLLFVNRNHESSPQMRLFPSLVDPPQSIMMAGRSKVKWKTVINKVHEGNDNFYDETGRGWDHAFKLGPRRSALASLPEDETKFPVSSWFKRLLIDGVQKLSLNSSLMRRPSPPGQPFRFRSDGSNLPWAIEHFKATRPNQYGRWIKHIQTALSDIEVVDTIERPEDRHRYLQVRYTNGFDLPSWVISDGTLRLLALTLIAYLDHPAIYLIEEPENGIHPLAVEIVFQALSSAYDSQILCATHSPVILSLAKPALVLCFGRTSEGATDVIRGSDHPNLKKWREETDLGTLFAAGVLG